MSYASIPRRARLRPTLARCTGLAIILSGTLVFAALAHEGETPIHYVAENGEDVGACDQPSTPCRTIEYALTQAQKGDQVLVAAGSYRFHPEDPAEVVTLLSPMVPVRGGY